MLGPCFTSCTLLLDCKLLGRWSLLAVHRFSFFIAGAAAAATLLLDPPLPSSTLCMTTAHKHTAECSQEVEEEEEARIKANFLLHFGHDFNLIIAALAVNGIYETHIIAYFIWLEQC